MPPELTRADYIVSSNIARTVQVCRQAVLDARRAVDWLASQGYERIGILGTSLGSCLAMLTAGLNGHINLDRLRELWTPISPFSYLDRIHSTRTLLVYARYDLTFPVDLSEHLVREFRQRGLPHEVAVLPAS
jgi:dienelactone hydrolase